MTPADRRSRLIALFEKIDQDITEARSLAWDETLSPEEHQQADSHLAFCEGAAKHTEILLWKSS